MKKQATDHQKKAAQQKCTGTQCHKNTTPQGKNKSSLSNKLIMKVGFYHHKGRSRVGAVVRALAFPPMWPRFDSRTNIMGCVCCFYTLLREVFLRVLRFSSFHKNQHLIWFDLIWFYLCFTVFPIITSVLDTIDTSIKFIIIIILITIIIIIITFKVFWVLTLQQSCFFVEDVFILSYHSWNCAVVCFNLNQSRKRYQMLADTRASIIEALDWIYSMIQYTKGYILPRSACLPLTVGINLCFGVLSNQSWKRYQMLVAFRPSIQL